ncbi:MAG: zinc protease [Candidatus Paceibacteria bacterium]|jgi:zinc protease
MKYQIDDKESYSFASITQNKSPIVTAYLTVDIHKERTVIEQAVQQMYSDALLSGAGKYTRDEFLSAVNLLGAGLSISISDSVLTIKLMSTLAEFSKLLKLTELMLAQPSFPKAQLNRIKSTTVNQLQESKEDSKTIAMQKLRNNIYGQNDRKYSSETDVVISTIESVTVGHFKSLHKTVLAQPWTCSITGESDAVKAFEQVVARLKKIKGGSVPFVGVHQQKPPRHTVEIKNIPSRHNIDFVIGAPLPITLHHPDLIPLSFAIAVLGKWGGFTGRLMSTVRELEGLTYGIYGRPEGFSGTEQGYWQITTFFAPEKALQGLTSTFREITKLYKSGITEEELVKFKTILLTQQTLLNDSASSLLSNLHTYHCQKFTLEEMITHKARISTVTLDEVNETIKTYLDPATLTISAAGPVGTVKKDIQNFINSV